MTLWAPTVDHFNDVPHERAVLCLHSRGGYAVIHCNGQCWKYSSHRVGHSRWPERANYIQRTFEYVEKFIGIESLIFEGNWIGLMLSHRRAITHFGQTMMMDNCGNW